MMKKLTAIFLALALCLSAAACGATAREAEEINFGDVISTDIMEFSPLSAHIVDTYKEAGTTWTVCKADAGNRVLVIPCTIKNLSTSAIKSNQFLAEVTVDDTYTFEPLIYNFGDIDPLDQTTVYFAVETTEDALNAASKFVLHFAFDDAMESKPESFQAADKEYKLTICADGSSANQITEYVIPTEPLAFNETVTVPDTAEITATDVMRFEIGEKIRYNNRSFASDEEKIRVALHGTFNNLSMTDSYWLHCINVTAVLDGYTYLCSLFNYTSGGAVDPGCSVEFIAIAEIPDQVMENLSSVTFYIGVNPGLEYKGNDYSSYSQRYNLELPAEMVEQLRTAQ